MKPAGAPRVGAPAGFIRIAMKYAAFLIITIFSVCGLAQTPTPAKSPTDDDVINVETTLVNIPVSVFNKKGQVVSNLKKSDFRVFEDGAEQEIEYFASVEQPFTVILLLDVSGSVRTKLAAIKKSALAFIDQLKPNDRVGAMTFDTRLNILNRDLQDRKGLRKAIQDIEPGSGTFLYATVEAVSDRILKRFTGRKALILFTDGEDMIPYTARSTYETSLRQAEASGALIYCLQFHGDDPFGFDNSRSKIAKAYLADLANKTGGRIYQAGKTSELQSAFSSIAEELRWQYSIGYYPPSLGTVNTRKKIRVEVKVPDLFTRSRENYTRNQ